MASREGPDARERRREIQDIERKSYDNDMWLKNEIHKLKRRLSVVEEHEQHLRETFKKYKEDKEQEQQMIARIRIRIRKEMQS